MTFTFLPSSMFCVSILTKESLSGRDCSWNKPRACPTKKIKTKEKIPLSNQSTTAHSLLMVVLRSNKR